MSLGPMELMLILGIALLAFGPSRLPGLGKSMGEAIRGFKKGLDGSDEEAKRAEQLKSGSATAEKQSEKEKNHV